MTMYKEFITVARALNKDLEITPILYGSLGLEKVTGISFFPQDIDILVPLTFLEEKWPDLQNTLEQLGYKLVDLHEHEFRKNSIKIGIAYSENLKSFADVDPTRLEIIEDNGAAYYSLATSDFLKVYKKSLLDGYRRTKKNNKDQKKIEILNQLITFN